MIKCNKFGINPIILQNKKKLIKIDVYFKNIITKEKYGYKLFEIFCSFCAHKIE
jgi:hypothetical protein